MIYFHWHRYAHCCSPPLNTPMSSLLTLSISLPLPHKFLFYVWKRRTKEFFINIQQFDLQSAYKLLFWRVLQDPRFGSYFSQWSWFVIRIILFMIWLTLEAIRYRVPGCLGWFPWSIRNSWSSPFLSEWITTKIPIDLSHINFIILFERFVKDLI